MDVEADPRNPNGLKVHGRALELELDGQYYYENLIKAAGLDRFLSWLGGAMALLVGFFLYLWRQNREHARTLTQASSAAALPHHESVVSEPGKAGETADT